MRRVLEESAPPGPGPGNLRGHLLRGAERLVGLLAVDLAIIGLARLLLRGVRADMLGDWAGAVARDALPQGAVSGAQLAVAIFLANVATGTYRAGDRWRDPGRLLAAAAAGVLLVTYSDFWHGSYGVVAGRSLAIWAVLGPLLVAARMGVHLATAGLIGSRPSHRVVEIVGDEVEKDGPDLGPRYLWVARVPQGEVPSDVHGMEALLAGGVDTIVVTGHLEAGRFGDLTDFALTHGCRLLCRPRSQRLLGIQSKRVWMDGHPFWELTTPGLRASQLVLKRALDIVASAALLLLLAPLLAVCALWVRLDSPGPVFFVQRRPGIQGRWFPMLKFRSMRVDAEDVLRADPALYRAFIDNDCKLPSELDPRLTRSGRFMRKTSLDELPQLLNVLAGHMSLVGPRPLVGPELENYGGRIPTLLSVKPGITGLWQISGRSRVSYPERAELDLEYVRGWSFLRDLWILSLTPLAVLLRRGAH